MRKTGRLGSNGPSEMGTPSPTLGNLPPPPASKTGWPWTEGCAPVPAGMPDGRRWPRVTVVTPSFNQAKFLEETLRSVLLQAYPNLEYVVIDGGSEDGSMEIIKKYEPWLDYWVSEPDRGQSHAINKGFRRATGEILAWLNSDDIYYPGALAAAARGMVESGHDIFLGAMDKTLVQPGEPARFVKRSTPFDGEPIHRFGVLGDGDGGDFHFYQPSMFWTRRLWEVTGGLDERYHYVMDMEWCNRALAEGARVATSEELLTRFTLHPKSKSVALNDRQHLEQAVMWLRFAMRPGFRRLSCLRSAVKPLRVTATLRAAGAYEGGRRVGGFFYRNTARALKLLESVVPGLRGRETLRSPPELSPLAPEGGKTVGTVRQTPGGVGKV